MPTRVNRPMGMRPKLEGAILNSLNHVMYSM
jgi:hypothetical protein